MAKAPFVAQWVQAGADIFQWGRKAAYWKGKKGWWASRQDVEGIKGPFRTPGAAQTWAEEPFRAQHRLAQQKLRDEAQPFRGHADRDRPASHLTTSTAQFWTATTKRQLHDDAASPSRNMELS